jgi:acyl-coenzyme A synthetase/AMP-(fatty) acid ligase
MNIAGETMEFLAALAKTARTNPFAIGIVTERTTIDYKTLDDLVWHFAGIIGDTMNLESLSPGDGASVAIRIRNPVMHFIVSLSLLRMGCTQIAIADGATIDIIEKSLEVANVGLLVCDKRDARISTAQLAFPRQVPATGARQSYPYNPDATAMLMLGSGTTGRKKLIPVTFKYLDSSVAIASTTESIAPFDRHLCLSPITYSFPKRRMYQCLLFEATAVFRENPRLPVLEFCRGLAVDHLTMVLPHARALTKPLVETGLAFPRLPRLKTLSIGSAPVSEELRTDLKTYVSPNLHVVYGTNEFGLACCADPATLAEHPGTIGKPCPGVEIQIVDDDDQPCKPNEIGNMRMKAVGMFEGYPQDVEESQRVLRDGWYYPGDMASMTEDGAVMFKGRLDDLIIFDGINIYPREIELALEMHRAVQEAAAFKFTNADGVELPGCAVILKADIEMSDLEVHCKETLGVRCPRLISAVQYFPRNAAGKIVKKELVALASSRYG